MAIKWFNKFTTLSKVEGLRIVLLACVILCQPLAFAGSQDSGPERYRVFPLKFISAQEGKQLLADVNITNVSQLNDSNTLLVTARQEELVKASALLSVVDSRQKYAVKVLLDASEANRMPAVDAMQAEISDSGVPVSIGTFFNLPGGTGYKAIVDIHNDSLIAVAPPVVMGKIVAIAQRVRPEARDLNEEQRVTGEKKEDADKLFNELLVSISEAEAVTRLATARRFAETSAPSLVTRDLSDEQPAEPNLAQPRVTEPDADAYQATRDEKVRPSYEPQPIPNADETLELALPEKLEVIQLLDLVGKYLNLNYVYDIKQLQGKEVNLKVQGPIKVRELYPLAESVLKFTGLVMTRKGNLVTIVPIDGALDIDPVLIDAQGGKIEYGDVVVTRIFRLDYIDTAQAKAILDGMKLGAVTELSGLGTLIVTGYAYRMNRVEEILEVIDKPGKPREFRFRQLKFTLAKTLAPKVKELVEQMGDISIAIAGPQAPAAAPGRRRPPRQPAQPQPAPGSAKPSIYLDADERTNRILMIGQEDELVVVEDLINALDVAQQDLRALRVYEIQHVDAGEVRKKLEELGIVGAGRASIPGRITARAAAPGAPPTPTPAAGPEAELPTEEMQVIVLESTNSLLVNASPEQHATIASVIAYVDSESIQQAIPYVVYPLQNQPPGHVAEVLEKLVQEVVRDKEGKIEKVVSKTEDNIVIVPDPNTFSLIVYANKKNQDWISTLIKSLDRRRPQVLIDCTLVEVTSTESFDLDLQLATKIPAMVPGGTMGSTVPAVVTPFISSGDKRNFSTIEGYSNPALATTAGGQGFYSDRHIQALLTAMESKSYGRVLAKPKILVNDGQKGIIRTTDTTNVKIETVIVPQDTGTNTGQYRTTTDFRSYEAGITLTIQPNISEGDLLLLIITLDRTDFKDVVDATKPPDTTSSNVDTIVTVPNNKTIILGGMLKLNQAKGGSKIPLLGDIPIVGGLFRSTSNSVRDSKLYVFVKANILRPEETLAGLPELERISDRNRAAFEKSEDKFQKYQDWPGIKPKPVDPLHVIEAE